MNNIPQLGAVNQKYHIGLQRFDRLTDSFLDHADNNPILNSMLSSQILPHTCILCGSPSLRPIDLCLPCEKDLPSLGHSCHQCSLPIPIETTSEPNTSPTATCGECQKHPPLFDASVSLLRYEFPVREMILRYKTTGLRAEGKVLAALFSQHIKANYQEPLPDLLIPVPMHAKKLRSRGFNHAADLAQQIGQELNIPSNADIAYRAFATDEQKGLTAKNRQKNLKNSFALNNKLDVNSIAIIDDVVTTGATTQEFARLLKTQNIPRIEVWSIARTPIGR